MVLVEQSLNTASAVAEQCVFMERGQTRYFGTVKGLLGRDDLARSVFLRDSGTPGAKAGSRSRPTAAAMSATGIRKEFGGIRAIDGVSLEVPVGRITGLIGPNGAGKTTILDVCSGFVTPYRGQVVFADRDVTALPAHERAGLGLGRVFQDARLAYRP